MPAYPWRANGYRRGGRLVGFGVTGDLEDEMSGGSLRYLCYEDTLNGIVERMEEIRAAADYLTDHGLHDAARMTMRCYETIKTIKKAEAVILEQARTMKDVWRAVEWCLSGDYGDDQVVSAVEKWRGQ